MTQETTTYPLCWPIGYKKTPSWKRHNSRFNQTMSNAQKHLRNEVARLQGRGLIVSTNLRLKLDGKLYASDLSKKIDEPGVAIYFKYNGRQVSMCCDQYKAVWENVYALAKGIEALRAITRYGISEFLERSFSGFAELPPSNGTPKTYTWWQVLEVSQSATRDEIKNAWRRLVSFYHPDKPTGDAEKFIQVQKAYEEAIK